MSITYELLQVGASPGALGPLSDTLSRDFVGSENPAMLELYQVAKEVALTDIAVLIVGESGSGKEILAHEILGHSSRADKPLVKIRCGQLGQIHTNGNSSSVEFDIDVSGPGTLLLDGVGELAPELQRSLLHLLDRDGLPAWARAETGAQRWRLISTSSVELDSEVQDSRFRADLYYRLNGVCLRIPPLRERKEDIEPLARFFAERFSEALGRKRQKRLSRSALKVLVNYQWPGNMRELQNVILRMVLLNDEEKGLRDLSSACGAMGPSGSVPPQEGETLSLKKASRLAARRVEKELILKALTQTHWNRKQAAQQLDISYKALLYKLRQLELDR